MVHSSDPTGRCPARHRIEQQRNALKKKFYDRVKQGLGGIVAMHLATKGVLYDSLHSGHGLPFWRSDQLSGVPAFTNPES